MTAVCLVNGIAGAAIDPLDRGLQYGDGVFRTLRVEAGQPRWLDAQLAKLSADAAALGIAAPAASVWRDDLERLSSRLARGVLRLSLTRGAGARGYRPPATATPTRIMMYDPTPPLSDRWPACGLHLRLCDLRLSEQPRLAGIKHLNRLENVMARSEWDDPDLHEGVLRDAHDRVISGVMSNLFFWRRARLCTPRLNRCGVAGVTRDRLMQRAVEAGIVVEENDFGLDEVLTADEVMLSNSVFGLRRVFRLGHQEWPQPVVSVHLSGLLDD